MVRALERSGLGIVVVVVLVAVAVLVFVALGNHLLDRWMLRPLAEITRSARRISAGDYQERVPEEGAAEIAGLAAALNTLTDQIVHNHSLLAENIQSLDETNHRLTQAHRELVQAEKMASLGHLSAGIAHEIGNPLGALIGYVSLLKRRGGDGEILDGLEREARRIDRIVRGLLEYARPEPANREPLDLNASVRRVIDLLRKQDALGKVSVTLGLGDGLLPVEGDPHRVDQIFVNLVRNAVVAMDGTGEVMIETRSERYTPDRQIPIRRANDPPGINYAHLRRARPGTPAAPQIAAGRDGVRVIVSDTGPGIPAESAGSVFDPFFTTKGPGEGTGLGLAIVAATIAEMGGRVTVESAAGHGATFNLWLPTMTGQS